MHVGYARVSSTGQSLAVQLDKLALVPCGKVYQEKQSGRTTDRLQLQACLDFIREGDTLIVTRLDRLARSLTDLCTILHRLDAKAVHFQVLDQSMDTTTPNGRLLYHIMGAVAEFENDLRQARQAEGIASARARGVPLGPRPRLTPEEVTALRDARAKRCLIRELMAQYGLSKASIYRYLATSASERVPGA